jgi:hypothetical protein
MRTTLDIPDETYRRLKIGAAMEGITIREILLEGAEIRLRIGSSGPRQDGRPRFPVIRSRQPGSLNLGEEGVYEFIPFP